MNKKLLKEVEKKLVEQKEELIRELEGFADKNKNVEDDYNAKFPQYGDHEDENAAEVADFEGDLYLEKTLEKSLKKVNEALQMIKKGSYGECTNCQKPIPEKRLLAFPTATKCMDCKRKTL
jgi:RNA polymerase-binding transcription factor